MSMAMGDEDYMGMALVAARVAADHDDVPVGCVLVHDGVVLAVGENRREVDNDPTAHAEVVALRAAATQVGRWRMDEVTAYVTLEPCAMCAGAISLARLRRVYFAASDPKGGAVEHGPRFFAQPTCHHAPEVYGGIRESEAADMLRAFFAARRG